MKKLLSIICTAILLCSIFVISASADVRENKNVADYTAEELGSYDLYGIIDKLGNNYVVENRRGGIGLTYSNYNFSIITDQERTKKINNANEIFEPLSDEEIAAFKETLVNKNAKLKMITIFSNGKLNEDISADMYYNDLTKYYGEFNCAEVNFVDPHDAGHSASYLYEINDSENHLITEFYFHDEHDADISNNPSPEKFKEVNPQLEEINYINNNYAENENTDSDSNDQTNSYTAQTLKTKTLSEIVEIMGGNFQYGPVYVGDNQTSSLAIGNPETLKGYEFIVHGITYRDFEKNWSTEIENIKAGKYTYDYIYVGSVGALDDKVTGDMTYNDLTAIYGDFDCIVAGGKGNVCYSVKADDGSDYATITFDKTGLSLSDTSSKAMKSANPKVETIIVPVNSAAQNPNTEKPDNNSNSVDNSNNGNNTSNSSTVKSPSTSTLGANGATIMFGITGVFLLAIVGCIYSVAVYRCRKDTL